jgi:hypothetical protein
MNWITASVICCNATSIEPCALAIPPNSNSHSLSFRRRSLFVTAAYEVFVSSELPNLRRHLARLVRATVCLFLPTRGSCQKRRSYPSACWLPAARCAMLTLVVLGADLQLLKHSRKCLEVRKLVHDSCCLCPLIRLRVPPRGTRSCLTFCSLLLQAQ